MSRVTRDFDAVVVGAGNAGLTAAATLQQAGLSPHRLAAPVIDPGT
jgi:flavin-dependent dehydrogenase